MKKKFKSFVDAKKFVQSLGIKNQREWHQFNKSGKKSKDIPSDPVGVYKKEWTSWGDFLGTGTVAPQVKAANWRNFKEAREYIHSLGLKNNIEWLNYCKSDKRPIDIPTNPHNTYKNKGWKGLGDWLGIQRISNVAKSKQFLSFEEARKFVHSLHFKNEKEWRQYLRSGKKPENIPSVPNSSYKNQGWASWGDWYGTGRIADRYKVWRPFNEAREFVRSLGLKNQEEWKKYSMSAKKPHDIPVTPHLVYKNKGWKSMGDWIGTGRIADQLKNYLPFPEAREFVCSLGLKSANDWRKYCNSGKKPVDIPVAPYNTYKNKGWNEWGDWLGTGTIALQKRKYRPFRDARKFIQKLGLKNNREWDEYCKSGKKPDDIPTAPWVVYSKVNVSKNKNEK